MNTDQQGNNLEQALNYADSMLQQVNRFEIELKLRAEPCIRPGLHVKCFNHLLSTGPENSLRLSPPSSDEDSDDDRGFPTIRQVSNQLLDFAALEMKDKPIKHSIHRPTIIISNLEAYHDPSRLQRTLAKICSHTFSVDKLDLDTPHGKTLNYLLSFQEYEDCNIYLR